MENNSTHSEQAGGNAGGSCQVSLSYDNGASFKVIRSFIGSCPAATQLMPTLNFTIPKSAPSGDALLSWSWFNREWEMYQNCAVIHVQNGGAGISALPDMFVADIGGECFTPRRDLDVLFPDPGADVVYGDWDYAIDYPSGPGCAPVKSMPRIGDTVTLAQTSTPTQTPTPTQTLTQTSTSLLGSMASSTLLAFTRASSTLLTSTRTQTATAHTLPGSNSTVCGIGHCYY